MTYSDTAAKTRPSSTLGLAARAKELAAGGRDIISFTVGEPDYDTPDYIKAAAISAINDGFTKYTPAAGTAELRRAICAKLLADNGLTYAENQIVVSNGAKHALANAFRAVLNPGDEVLLPAPYWLSYPEMVRLAGGVPVPVASDAGRGYKPALERLEAACTSRAKALLINSPNNPSGAVYDEDELRRLAEFARERDLVIISDEVYEKLVYGGARHVSVASLSADAYGRTVVINGFSKTYAMTGWRVGYSACAADLAKIIAGAQSHLTGGANSIAQKAAEAALCGGAAQLAAMRESYERRRDLLMAALEGLGGVSADVPQGAFYVFADVSRLCADVGCADAAELAEALLERAGVAVVPCGDFGAPGHVRFTYAIADERITEGVARIKQFVTGPR